MIESRIRTYNRLKQQANDETSARKQELILVVAFLVIVSTIIFLPQLATALKYSLLPLSLVLLFKYDSFEYLIFPLCFLDNPMGTLIMGRFTLLIFYLPFLFYKLFIKKKSKIKRSYLLVLVLSILYFAFAYSYYGNVSIKQIIIIICSMIIGEECLKERERFDGLFAVLYLSSLIPALALCFGLTGTVGETERMAGVGFSDPNYASFVCCIGLCVLLNVQFNKPYKKALQTIACVIIIIGIFRSGSRAGLLVALGILVLKIILTRGVTKRIKIAVGIAAVAVIGLFLINANVIRISNLDYILERWEETFNAFTVGDVEYATAARSSIANTYMDYFLREGLLRQLFGFNVVGTQSIFSAIGRTVVTHNVYIDYLMAFGVFGAIVMFGLYLSRLYNYYKLYRATSDPAYLAVVEIKTAMLVFGASLAMLQTYIWWFLFLI
ncbi:MAG: hypothetical protein Q4C04_00260 [Clostridia bacterium]|nr:hypothetical protein [Clostridia bacterium]